VSLYIKTMSKVRKKTFKRDVHLHIDKAYIFIENNLPRNYVELVIEKLPPNRKTILSQNIRNVKNRYTKYPLNRLYILEALVEVAKDFKKSTTKIEKLISN